MTCSHDVDADAHAETLEKHCSYTEPYGGGSGYAYEEFE